MESYCKNGICSSCGECCSPAPIPITKKEYEAIKIFVKENDVKQTPPTPIDDKIKLECCFRDVENKKCKIYEVRPEICRRFQCDNNAKKIYDDKEELHKKSYYNRVINNDMTNITNFDILFYNDAIPLMKYLYYHLSNETDNKNEIKTLLYGMMIENGSKETRKIVGKGIKINNGKRI